MLFCVRCGENFGGANYCAGCGLRAPSGEDFGVAAAVDVETTGLSGRDELVEFSAAAFEFHRFTGEIAGVVDEYTGLREPNCPISPEAERIHGLSAVSLRGRRLDGAAVARLLRGAEFIVAHHAAFDRRFVEGLYPELGPLTWKCSYREIQWEMHGLPRATLRDLLSVHGIVNERAHRAASDVSSLIALLGTLGSRGEPYFKELLNAGRTRSAASTTSR